ncbi:MAG TPA: nitroreductase family protein [Galbitalea sp.]
MTAAAPEFRSGHHRPIADDDSLGTSSARLRPRGAAEGPGRVFRCRVASRDRRRSPALALGGHPRRGEAAQVWGGISQELPGDARLVRPGRRRGTKAAAAEPHEDEKYHEKFNENLAAMEKLMRSITVLIERMGEAPVIVVPCVIGRADGDVTTSWVASQFGSVFPAVWNLQLALRTRGLGSCITAAHLEYEREIAELLSIPYDTVMQVCAVPVAYYTGSSFGKARRRPRDEVVFIETFDASSMQESGW